MKLAHAFLMTFFAREATLLATFANAVILARGMGAAGLGSYFLVVAAANLLAQGFSLGINYSNSILAARRPESAGMLFTLSAAPLLIYVPVVIALSLAGPGATAWMLGSMPSEHRHYLWIGAGIILLTQNVGGVIFGLERYRGFNLVFSLPVIGLCLTDLVLFLAGALSVERVLLAWTAWLGVGGLLMSGLLARRNPPRLSVDFPLLRQLLAMGGRALICAVFGFTTYRGMHLLLNRYQGPSAVGQYGAMAAFSDLLAHAPGILSAILMNRASAETVSPAQVVKLLRLHVVVSLLGGLALAGLAPLVLRHAFGAGFADAPRALWILLAGSYGAGFYSIASGYFTGKHGYPVVSIVLVGLTTVLSLGLGLLLVPRLSLVGAAVAWSSATGAVSVLALIVFFRECRADVGWGEIRPRRDDLHTLQGLIAGLRASWAGRASGKGL